MMMMMVVMVVVMVVVMMVCTKSLFFIHFYLYTPIQYGSWYIYIYIKKFKKKIFFFTVNINNNRSNNLTNILSSLLFSTSSIVKTTKLPSSSPSSLLLSSSLATELPGDWKCEKYDDSVVVKLNVDAIYLKPICSRKEPRFILGTDEEYNVEHHQLEKNMYLMNKLNTEQRNIYNYIENNPNDIVIIQAGPGCGKSFVLKTIAYNQKKYFDTIIYKNDLLASFRYNSRRNSVASFMMKCLDLKYYSYLALDRQLASSMDAYEFMLTIISMLRRSSLNDVEGSIFFLDEYTVMSKPFLVVILILFEYYKIGAIICGDRNQLQNIHNSKHTVLSSYWMAKSFSKREFLLTTNERCGDTTYNSVIQLFSEYSSSSLLDEYAFAMVSAFFLRQLMEPIKYNCIHLAATHRELAQSAHMMVCQQKYPTSFYEIDMSRVRNKKNSKNNGQTLCQTQETTRYLSKITTDDANTSCDVISTNVIEKFLPYLPLVIGAPYYVEKHSEYSIGQLIEYDAEKQTVTLEMESDKLKKTFGKSSINKGVVFQPHYEYLMQNEVSGHLHNFPIYPANFMSVHKCQGCTIGGELNLMLNKTTYQGLYVALSRVMNPNQITRITVKNQMSHLVSTIINFPQYCENRVPTAEEVRAKMINYTFYDVSGIGISDNSNATFKQFGNLGFAFLATDVVSEKKEFRDLIYKLAIGYSGCVTRCLKQTPIKPTIDPNLMTMGKIIKYRDIMLALSCIDEYDRNVWLHEFLINNVDLLPLLPDNFKRDSGKMNTTNAPLKDSTILTKLTGFDSAYDLNVSSVEYIKSIAKNIIRLNTTDQLEHEKYRIEMPQPNVSIETTEFCANVYKKYQKKEICTMNWLMNELNCLLERNQNVETLKLSEGLTNQLNKNIDGSSNSSNSTTINNNINNISSSSSSNNNIDNKNAYDMIGSLSKCKTPSNSIINKLALNTGDIANKFTKINKESSMLNLQPSTSSSSSSSSSLIKTKIIDSISNNLKRCAESNKSSNVESINNNITATSNNNTNRFTNFTNTCNMSNDFAILKRKRL
ncbi:DNA helicase 2 [Mauternbach virus]|uniref:DNA helicase 2 n=1 Tax=Mauternbach virus TaxID=2486603 RepID=A0A3G3E852_9VIRU|nr:DNA helicase 2 [Mauternbach virus]AYP97894.1 DNA helicase 2 [Mauternbach virus]